MRILVVDGNNLIARGTYVLPNAQTPDNRPVGGLYIAIKMIRAFLAVENHDAVLVALDNGVPAFRKEVCPEYKAQRREARTPEEEKVHRAYVAQVDMCQELFRPFGLVTARAKGWEGDDVVAALALSRLKEHTVTVLSSDRDFTQLVDGSRVRMWDVGKDRWVDPDPHFCLKRCMDPKASDNLDGVPGIGAKKADKLVEACLTSGAEATLPGFLAWCAEREKVDDPLGRMCKKVVAEQQKMRANWRCTSLAATASECDAVLKFRRTEPDKDLARAAIRELGLKPLAEEFSALWPPFGSLRCPV